MNNLPDDLLVFDSNIAKCSFWVVIVVERVQFVNASYSMCQNRQLASNVNNQGAKKANGYCVTVIIIKHGRLRNIHESVCPCIGNVEEKTHPIR